MNQKALYKTSLDTAADAVSEVLDAFIQKVLKKDAIDALPTTDQFKPFIDHLMEEVKKVRGHRCHAGLKDAANLAARLIRVIEKIRNRAMKKKGAKSNKPGGQAGEDVLSCDGGIPTSLQNLQTFFADATGENSGLVFKHGLGSDEKDIENLWPQKGAYSGKPFHLQLGPVKEFAKGVMGQGYYKKLTTWLNGFVDEQKVQQGSTAILIPSAVSSLNKSKGEVFPASLLAHPGFVGSEKTWGSHIYIYIYIYVHMYIYI